ncbi:MAG: hypothetical protein DME40_06995 [Verrucomicrobia bacterium]|nr:MAG: hypothetical protein DME40_06995 [Verrucomicrobiota bacterium]
MSAILEPVRPIELKEIREARSRITNTIFRTPLVRLELGPNFPDIRLKLENLQPINAYKLRGAANAVAMLSESERRRGVWTISAGNAGQGVAYAARKAGVPCSVVVIETAPASKVERMRRLGAKLIPVPFDDAWKAMEDRTFAEAGSESLGRGAGNGGAGGAVFRETIAADLHGVETIVCRWRRWQKYFPADVAKDAAGRGWFNCR